MQPVEFGETGVGFSHYPYPGASVHPNGVAAYAEIRDVDPRAAPPEIRLRSGEVLFVHATQREELTRVAERRSLPIVQRVDVWGLLLEPFLDTEFDLDRQERTLVRLAENGVPRSEALALRSRFARRMLRYNAIHWDWTHLGLTDLLDASLGRVLPPWLPIRRSRFERLYREAMALAERGRPYPSGADA